MASIIEASSSAYQLQPNISSNQTYWSCEEFEEELPTSSKPYLQKYSSASTIDLEENQQQSSEVSKKEFEQLVHKYNLYAYVQTDFTSYPPLPNYAESTQPSTTSDSPNRQPEMSHIQSQSQYNEGHSLEAIKKICGVPARLTGFFSLVIQTIVLIVAIGLSVLAFYQLGGFKMLGAKVLNETEQNDNTLFPTPAMLEIKHILSNDTDSFSLTDQDYGWNETFDADNMTSTNKSKHGSSLLQQIGPIYLRVGKAELDVISLLRLSTLIYIGLGVFWLISLACLAMSLRYEVLDLVYINTFILTIVLIYTLVQGLLVGIIIFYQVSEKIAY